MKATLCLEGQMKLTENPQVWLERRALSLDEDRVDGATCRGYDERCAYLRLLACPQAAGPLGGGVRLQRSSGGCSGTKQRVRWQVARSCD